MIVKSMLSIGLIAAAISANASIWEGASVPKNGMGHPNIKQDVDTLVESYLRSANIPGLTVAIAEDDKLLYTSGHGVSNWNTQQEMQANFRASIGSSSKVLVSMGMFHLLENSGNYSLNSKVYGANGILSNSDYSDAYTKGLKRHYPIVGMAINRLNRVVTWYSDGKYTVGTADDLDAYRGPRSYTLAPGKTTADVLDMAIGGTQGLTITYYRDNTYSVGKAFDLDYFFVGGDEFEAVHGADKIVGISADTTRNMFYAYYDNGTVSSGRSMSNLKNRWVKDFSTPTNFKNRYKIRAVARSDNNNMLAWYTGGKFSRGNATNLEAISASQDYSRRTVYNSIRPWKKAYQNIKIKHLLSHTAGLIRSGNREHTRARYPIALAQYNDDYLIPYKYSNMYVLSTNSLLFKPGTDTSYSNHGMGLAGHLIKEISGLDWYEYLRTYILNPTRTFNIVPLGQYHNPSIDSWHHNVDEDDNVTVRAKVFWPAPGSAAGSLRASAQDLAAVMVKMSPYSSYPEVISDESLTIMESRPFPETASNRAHGWQISCQSNNTSACGGRKLYHNGKTGNGTSFIAKYKQYDLTKNNKSATANNIQIAVVSNSGDTSTTQLEKLADELAILVHNAFITDNYDLFQVNPT